MTGKDSEGYRFHWKDIGDIEKGRPNLGPDMKVGVYRLMEYSLRDVLSEKCGEAAAREIFVDAGRLAGSELCKNLLNRDLDLSKFLVELQNKLRDLDIGVLRIEKADWENMHFVLTVSEDLDCSGLPATGETVCDYDEGFIAGILSTYSGTDFCVKEVDCWASGARVCRFDARPKEGK